MTLYNLCKLAGLVIETDVHNLCTRLIPQVGLARYKRYKQRQAIIPDLRIFLPIGKQKKSVLQDVKAISVSQTRNKLTWEERVVNRRADLVHNEYLDKARRVDNLFCGIELGEVGPIEAKLLSYKCIRGLVLGAFSEVSKPVQQLGDAEGEGGAGEGHEGREGHPGGTALLEALHSWGEGAVPQPACQVRAYWAWAQGGYRQVCWCACHDAHHGEGQANLPPESLQLATQC